MAPLGVGDKLAELAVEDETQGRLLSAGNKLSRAATYYLTAERMQAHSYAPRKVLYAKFQNAFQRGVQLARENCERVEIPYADAHIAGLYVRAEGVTGRAPILVQINGLDSTKEIDLPRRRPARPGAARHRLADHRSARYR